MIMHIFNLFNVLYYFFSTKVHDPGLKGDLAWNDFAVSVEGSGIKYICSCANININR